MQPAPSLDHRYRHETVKGGRIPPPCQEEYRSTDDLFKWMSRQFKSAGNTYTASVYGTHIYLTRDPDFAYYVLVENWQNYVKGKLIKRIALLLGNGLIVSEGKLWKRQRRMIQPAFQHESIGALTGMIVSANAALLEKWRLAAQKKQSVNVTRDVSGLVLEIVLRFIFGADYNEAHDKFIGLSEDPARDLAFAQKFRSLGKIILEIAARRRREISNSSDILGTLMKARDSNTGETMQDAQLINEILTLIVAGHETTAISLNWIWYLLSQYPEVNQNLTTELDNVPSFPKLEDLANYPYARKIIDETLRLYPAVWLVTRKALRDDRVGGYFVPAGTEIYISPYFIQRHPDIWEHPDRFNPDRFESASSKHRHRLATIPFSAGPRNCIGEFFARVEMQIHLLMIAQHLRLRHVQSTPLELQASVNLRSKNEFIMYPELKASD